MHMKVALEFKEFIHPHPPVLFIHQIPLSCKALSQLSYRLCLILRRCYFRNCKEGFDHRNDLIAQSFFPEETDDF